MKKSNKKTFLMRTEYIIKTLQKLILVKMNNGPYLSGDSIAKLCDYVVPSPLPEQHKLLKKVIESKSIFVHGHDFIEFVKLTDRFLDGKVLISGNSDQNFTKPIVLNAKPNLVLCQNNAIKHQSSIKTLPIGIENIKLARSGFKHQHRGVESFRYLDRVLVPPMSPTNSTRIEVIEYAKKYPDLFEVKSDYLPPKKYFDLLKEYRFIFACEGNGFDTHRLWEILYKNSFPVVIKSDWSETLQWLKLPILMLEKIEDVTKDLLRDFSKKNSGFRAIDTPQLWTPYWKNLLITMTKNEN